MINIQKLSRAFEAKTLGEAEIDEVRALCCENELFYRYCPPFVTAESIRADMRALPKNKEQKNKLYVGFYDASELVAVMDLILAYPDDETAFLGFFMLKRSLQGAGVGSALFGEICAFLRENGFSYAKLGVVKGNPQSFRFWSKNGFTAFGEESPKEEYIVVPMRKVL